jgi:soluble lytic murein transglycosylase-like protein
VARRPSALAAPRSRELPDAAPPAAADTVEVARGTHRGDPGGAVPIDPLGSTQPAGAPAASAAAAAPTGAPATNPAVPDFSALLQQKLSEPAAALQQIRANVASLRNGGALRAPSNTARSTSASALASGLASTSGLSSAATSKLLALRETASAGPDPYGWRSMARSIGDSVVGPGFGALFERQIGQESGFAPDVALGLRTSSAGAEGLAQLMPQYYPGVDRANPVQSLTAGAQSMKHYLEAWDGDVRKALASYNAGLGRVRSAVQAHGDQWESALPAEARQYLKSIVGSQDMTVALSPDTGAAVFGGYGPGGVLVSPVDRVTQQQALGAVLQMIAATGAGVRAPADGTVLSVAPGADGTLGMTLDHGNGWTTLLQGLASANVAPGDTVRRSDMIGALAGASGGSGALGLGVQLDGQAVDPRRYLLASQLASLSGLSGVAGAGSSGGLSGGGAFP